MMQSQTSFPGKPKLLDQLRTFMRARRYRRHGKRVRYPDPHARTGTLAVRSSLPQLTHAPLMARRIAFQMQ